MVKNLKIGDKIELEWYDPIDQSGWCQDEQLYQELERLSSMPVITVGYFAGESDNYIAVASSDGDRYGEGTIGRWGNWQAIPKASIIKIKKLHK
ncbi:MAG: hypothetical protein ACK4NX_02090 [Candidatus Paceibacteria bacterium]